MDALRHLVANIPDWLKRLDELNDQIEQRQVELAQVSESSSGSNASSAARSLRNRGSTESLKPKDEPEAHPTDPNPDAPAPKAAAAQPTTPPTAAAGDAPPPSSPSGSNTPSALQRQTNQVKAQAQARARATLRKRQRTDSVVSAEGAAPKYRTRSLIIVYYDSYVQSFFEELVKFVSASRNMMRKAKMAAKVAQIKRLAEMEMDDDDEENNANTTLASAPSTSPSLQVDPAVLAASGSIPNAALEVASGDEAPQTLRYVSTRRMQPVSRTPNMLVTAAGRPIYPRAAARAGARNAPEKQPDVYDELDKGLEYVQSMCEHAAHQFLRDGDCGEEVANIQRRLGETKELADKEMDRVKREEPETLSSADETKGRSFRPQSMRREHMESPSGKDGTSKLEVDDVIAVDGADEAEMEPPKLVYKSTRMMR